MGSKRRRATSPSSSVSGGDFDDSHHSTNIPGPSRKRRRLSNLPTVDPVSTFLLCTTSLRGDTASLPGKCWIVKWMIICSTYTLALNLLLPLFRTLFSFGLFLSPQFNLFLSHFPFAAFLFLLMILADGRMLEKELKS